jgi:hypothetical protein
VEVKINGRLFTLSQRRASDVLELAAAVEKRGESDSLMNYLSLAQIISDSLKATYKSLGPLKGWRYRTFASSRGVRCLLDALSPSELGEAYGKLSEIEGTKKKVQEVVSELVARSQEG